MTLSPQSTGAEPGTEAVMDLPVFADVAAAAERIAEHAVVTPLLESAALNERVGGRILLKAETLQRTGSFKFRGAFNRLSQIPQSARAAGVVACSSGNHGQGVAAAAAILGIPATIVMPADAPSIKIKNTRGYGAEVVLYDRFNDQREEIANNIAKRQGATLISPYDDPAIVAGQGTCGLEIARQAKAIDAPLDALLICCGGGGLSAGCGLALAELSPATKVYCVEPRNFDDTARSLKMGHRVSNDPAARSFCDALLVPTPGALTFALNHELLAGGISVTDAEVAAAMAFAFRVLKLVIEPGGAVALAAILAGHFDAKDRTVAVTLSGGNVDSKLFQEVIAKNDDES